MKKTALFIILISRDMIGPDDVIFRNRYIWNKNKIDYYEQFQEYFSRQDEN